MSYIFIQHQAGVLLFLSVLMLIVLSNFMVLRRLGSYPRPRATPFVSILVPARNEEYNIRACVESLLAQDYANYELIVLDDGSTDSTGAILSQLAVDNDRLRVMQGSTLPQGWLGKSWACHQLAQKAKGELLLFVDADTRHHQRMLSEAVAAQVADQTDLLSAFPRQKVESLFEKLVVPVIPWSMFTFVPLALAYRMQTPMLSAAIGQFMLFRREAYDAVGGHGAVRTSVVDDLTLARLIKAAGLKWRLIDGTHRVECRMYRNAGEVVRGVSRTLFGVFVNHVAVHLFVWFWLAIVFTEPLIVLAVTAAGAQLPELSTWMAGVSAALSLLLWLIVYIRFGIPFYLAFLYPLTMIVMLVIANRSVFVTLTGHVNWKGRHVVTPLK